MKIFFRDKKRVRTKLIHFKDIKNELYINQKWEGPSKTDSDIQKQYRDTIQNNLISEDGVKIQKLKEDISDNLIRIAVTEKRTKENIDMLVSTLKEIK